jgi:hypothetical protein
MKKIFFFILLALPFAAISQTHSGYTASYSSKFIIANPGYSEKVLMLWRDFNNNTLDAHLDMFADTVSMTLANGAMIKGKAENLAGAKQFRSSVTDYKSTVDAWVSLKSTDRNENVVCIWGEEEYTDKDGKKVKTSLQEVWGFNKDGKVDLMLQYARPGGM